MKLSTPILVAAATLANLSAAAPAPAAEPLASISSRDTITKRGNEGSCDINNPKGDGNNNVEVYIHTRGYWANDWGQGLLDNLRGQCGGDIWGWGFDYVNGDNSLAGTAKFYAPRWRIINDRQWCENGKTFCSTNCIENAVWLASNAATDGAIWNMHCKVQGVD